MRAALVVVAVLALLAGCSLDTSTTATGSGPTPTPPAGSSSPRQTDLLLTDDGNEYVTPRPLPSEPATLNRTVAATFAREYERAFAHNHELGDEVRRVEVTLQGTSARAVGDGYRVRIHVWTRTRTAGGNGTPSTVEGFYDAHYYVSESVLRRAETDRHGTLPDERLRESGLTLACWG